MTNAYNLSHSDQDAYMFSVRFLEAYNKYRDNDCSDSHLDKKAFKVYEYLIDNGFKEGKISTVLYTYLVLSIVNINDKDAIKEQVTKPFSQFYLRLAHDISMGTKTFHSNLLDRPYGKTNEDILATQTYGMAAIDLAVGFDKKQKVFVKEL